MSLKSAIITTWAEFEALEEVWDALLIQSDANNIFLRWDWINCWRNTAEKPITPYIVTLKKDNQLLAIAPFYEQNYQLVTGIKYKALRFAGDQGIGSEYSNFIVHYSDSEKLKKQCWKILLDHQRNWDFIWLTNIDQWTNGGKNLVSTLNQVPGLNNHQREMEFAVTSLPSLDTEILSNLSKSLRSNIKQTQKHLNETGQWQIKVTEQVDTLEEDLNTLFSLHNKRWQEAGLQGSFERRPAMARFYHLFTKKALQHGWLRLLSLQVNDEVQAMQLGYVYQQRFIAIQEGFNPDFLAGTGQVLRYFSFQKNIQEQVKEYDFLGIYTNHKRRWLADKRVGCELFIYPNKIKNMPFKLKAIWPTGAYLNEV